MVVVWCRMGQFITDRLRLSISDKFLLPFLGTCGGALESFGYKTRARVFQ